MRSCTVVEIASTTLGRPAVARSHLRSHGRNRRPPRRAGREELGQLDDDALGAALDDHPVVRDRCATRRHRLAQLIAGESPAMLAASSSHETIPSREIADRSNAAARSRAERMLSGSPGAYE